MGLFTGNNLDSLETLFIDQLQDLYDAEQRLVKALPKMAAAARSPALKSAFEEHLKQTEIHVSRLEQVFEEMGQDAEAKTCDAMKGLISEGEEVINATGSDQVKDAGLIAAAQRVEHYEISGYGTARTFANHLGRPDVAELLQETLDEEKETDQNLTELAERSINAKASTAGE